MSAELNVFLAKNLATRGEHPALELAGTAVSYAELAERVERVAAWLEQQGVQRGQRVVVHLHKSVEEVVAIWAIARIGAVFVDVHYRWTL
jgi:acyl-CoA synthetase (AMP-forming)/AMP-acid ligase II